MKYILMLNGTKADFEWYLKWPKKDRQAHTAYMRALNKDLKDLGVFVAGEGLGFPEEAKIVRADSNGTPITDGVFPESKEFLAGFCIVDVESAKQAYEIAARMSAAPHPEHDGGNEPVEVRQIMSGPPEEFV